MKLIKPIGKEDIQVALDEVAAKCSAETSNLLRAVYDSFSPVIEQAEPPQAQPVAPTGWYAPR